MLTAISEKTGVREDIIEKDYYLTLLLSELASWQDELLKMLEYKRCEEQNRIGSDLAQKPFADFLLFKALESDAKLQATFAEMQRVYVFNEADTIPFSDVVTQMVKLYKLLQGLDR